MRRLGCRYRLVLDSFLWLRWRFPFTDSALFHSSMVHTRTDEAVSVVSSLSSATFSAASCSEKVVHWFWADDAEQTTGDNLPVKTVFTPSAAEASSSPFTYIKHATAYTCSFGVLNKCIRLRFWSAAGWKKVDKPNGQGTGIKSYQTSPQHRKNEGTACSVLWSDKCRDTGHHN